MNGRPTSAERAALLAVGIPNTSRAQAAIALGISERALESRLRRLYRKLGVGSAVQAAAVIARLDSTQALKSSTQGGVPARRFSSEVASSR